VNAIGHPCAADVFGMGAHHGSEFVVVERLTGILVSQHIADTHQISIDACIDMLTKIADGLQAVHSANLWMGDLRAEAILLAPSRRVVFTKFAAGQFEPDDEPEPECFAPEVIQGATPADHAGFIAIDLYALGLLAVRMLIGRDPYVGDTPKATRFNHVHQRPPVLSTIRSDVPTELSDLVEELLAKEAGQRPRSAHAVVGQLRTIAERQSSSRRILRVLIADESSERVRPLWSALRRAYSRTVVDASHSSADALTKLRRDKPDVFVVDLALPGKMNGFELCMTLNNDHSAKGCTIVAVADHVKPSDAALLESMGVRFVLTRDKLGDTLGKVIRELASGSRGGGDKPSVSG
jgi:serine/threonine protein kinase